MAIVSVCSTPLLRRSRTFVTRAPKPAAARRYRHCVSPLRATLGVIALLLAAVPATASARTDGSITHSKRLWATVNVCDTVGHPDSIGIRGSMPGSGDKAETMFMRFQVQYFTPSDRLWHNLGAEADSGFVEVGSARFRSRQYGVTFTITPPQTGKAPYVLRGAVTFEWREDSQVVRRARTRTSARHPNPAGADPAGYTAATCSITGRRG